MREKINQSLELAAGVYGFKDIHAIEGIHPLTASFWGTIRGALDFVDPTRYYRINVHEWRIIDWGGRTRNEIEQRNNSLVYLSHLGSLIGISAGVTVGLIQKDAISGILAGTVAKFACNTLTHLALSKDQK